MKKPKHGDLRVWHVPQIPMKSFNVDVSSVCEAKLILDVLANYDIFQLANRIKPDYSNAGGLSVFDKNDKTDGKDGSWVDWYSEDGEDIGFYSLEMIRDSPPRTQL